MTTLADLRRESLAEQKADRADSETATALLETAETEDVPSRNDAVPKASNYASNLSLQQHSKIATKIDSNNAFPDLAITDSINPIVEDLRKTSLEQLNIRIPAGFKEWLAEEAHRRRREGVTQQSLVTDALEAMIRSQMEANQTDVNR